MSKFAVIKTQGHQYIVEEGQELLVDKLTTKEPEISVLMVSDEEKIEVGKPTLTNKIKVKVVESELKGEKIEVIKYKAKSRYRKHIGFRPKYTKLLIEKIS